VHWVGNGVSSVMRETVGVEKKPAAGWVRRIISTLGLIVMAVLGWHLWNSWDQTAIEDLTEDNPLVFFGLMALLPALGFPATPFYLVAGASYETGFGLAGTLTAVALNLSLCYWIARSGLRPVVRKLLTRAGIRFPEVKEKNEFKFAVLVKLTPGVPVFAKNYLLGLADIPFKIYFPVSMVIAGIYAASFVILGESMLERDPWKAVGVGAFLALIGGAVFWWRRRMRLRGKDPK